MNRKTKMRTDNRDWPSIISQFKKSGMSANAFAAKIGIHGTTLGYQLKKKQPKAAKRSPFVQVGTDDRIEVIAGKVTIKLPITITSEQLKNVLGAFEE